MDVIEIEGILTNEGWEDYSDVEEGRREYIDIDEVMKGFQIFDSIPIIDSHDGGLPVVDPDVVIGKFVNPRVVQLKVDGKQVKAIAGTFQFFKDRIPTWLKKRIDNGLEINVSFGRWTRLDDQNVQRDVRPEHVAVLQGDNPRCPDQVCGINKESIQEQLRTITSFKDWDDCIKKMLEQGYSREVAEKICGKLKDRCDSSLVTYLMKNNEARDLSGSVLRVSMTTINVGETRLNPVNEKNKRVVEMSEVEQPCPKESEASDQPDIYALLTEIKELLVSGKESQETLTEGEPAETDELEQLRQENEQLRAKVEELQAIIEQLQKAAQQVQEVTNEMKESAIKLGLIDEDDKTEYSYEDLKRIFQGYQRASKAGLARESSFVLPYGDGGSSRASEDKKELSLSEMYKQKYQEFKQKGWI